MLSRLVIDFLPRSKCLLISQLQSPSAVTGAQENKVSHCCHCFPICHEVMGPDAMIFIFWILSFTPTFSLSSFAFIKRLFSSSLLFFSMSRWWRNRVGRSLFPQQIHQKIIWILSNLYKTTSEHWQKAQGTQKGSPFSLKGGVWLLAWLLSPLWLSLFSPRWPLSPPFPFSSLLNSESLWVLWAVENT